MAIYSVLEPPVRDEASLAGAVVIKDGFSVVAFIAPLIWFLWYRMWLEALGVLVVSAALGSVSMIPGLEAVPLLGVLVSLFIGMEARSFRANALRRHGWTDWGVVVAASQEEAELRYMHEAVGNGDSNDRLVVRADQVEPGAGALRPSPVTTSTFGLIDYPRKA